jgi:hypothetical protein
MIKLEPSVPPPPTICKFVFFFVNLPKAVPVLAPSSLPGYRIVQPHFEHRSVNTVFIVRDNSNGECWYRIGFPGGNAGNICQAVYLLIHKTVVPSNLPNNLVMLPKPLHSHPNQN